MTGSESGQHTTDVPFERREVVVVGGGQAGLAIGYFLARHGRDFVILEAAGRPAGRRVAAALGLAQAVHLGPLRRAARSRFPRRPSWIDVRVFDGAGRAVHRRGVTESPGLYFLGLTWQHTRGSALLGWVGDDAEHIAQRIDALQASRPVEAPAAERLG